MEEQKKYTEEEIKEAMSNPKKKVVEGENGEVKILDKMYG